MARPHRGRLCHSVIPAQAGIALDLAVDVEPKATSTARAIPAFAGMTSIFFSNE
jgi:hypothetical protein